MEVYPPRSTIEYIPAKWKHKPKLIVEPMGYLKLVDSIQFGDFPASHVADYQRVVESVYWRVLSEGFGPTAEAGGQHP